MGDGIDFHVITNDDGALGYPLPVDTPDLRREAVDEMIAYAGLNGIEGCSPDEMLARAKVVTLTEHLTEPDGCGCEDIGWWCQDGDGESLAWLWVRDN